MYIWIWLETTNPKTNSSTVDHQYCSEISAVLMVSFWCIDPWRYLPPIETVNIKIEIWSRAFWCMERVCVCVCLRVLCWWVNWGLAQCLRNGNGKAGLFFINLNGLNVLNLSSSIHDYYMIISCCLSVMCCSGDLFLTEWMCYTLVS